MFDEPDEAPAERASNPADRAKEKADEFRTHSELAAVFEGARKFDAQLLPGLDSQVARDIQRGFGKLDKSRSPDSPLIPESSAALAAQLLNGPAEWHLSTNDYHLFRRPGELMIARWLAGEEVATYYGRLQAHFDAALDGFKEDERQANEWRQDPDTLAFLKALDGIEVKMAGRYLRDPIRTHNLFVLSTQSADELNIAYLCDHVMDVPVADLVGTASAPPDDPTEADLTWFFKLFSLRGMHEGVEQMCFFTFLQKTDESSGW